MSRSPNQIHEDTSRNPSNESGALSYAGKVREKTGKILSSFGTIASAGALTIAMTTGTPVQATESVNYTDATAEAGMNLKWSPILSKSTIKTDTPAEKTSNVIVKRVPVKDFEETLRSLIGTPYIKGVSDCSGIMRMALEKLGAIDKTGFIGSAATIMRTLTVDNRSLKEARPGDLVYWIPRRDKTAHHIAYVISVGADGIRIIDASTDEGGAEERFISRERMNSKHGVRVGTPTFLQI